MPITSHQHISAALLATDNCRVHAFSQISVSISTGSLQAQSQRIKETEILNVVTDIWKRKTYQGALNHTHISVNKSPMKLENNDLVI